MSSCPQCEMVAAPDTRFCEGCGASLDGVAQSVDPPTRPTGGERRKNCRCPPDDVDPDEYGFCRACGFRLPEPPPSSEPSLVLPVDADLAALSDRGRRYRRTGQANQDAAIAARFRDGTALLAVADGVSSANGAEAASAAAVAALRYVLESADGRESSSRLMLRAIEAAQAAVVAVQVVRPDPAKDPPETTIAAALVRDGRATLGWVGDSRAYVISGRRGRALTRDDSWLAEVVDAGIMTLEAALADRRAHAITQCLGVTDMDLEIHIEEVPVKLDTWLLLCTDGLWNYLEDGSRLAGALAELPPEADAITRCSRLAAIANESGGRDNISVAMLRITPAVTRPAPIWRRGGRAPGITPPGWPNAIDIDHDQKRGFWVQEQRHDNKPEAAWLIDWNGKLLHTVMTNCKDTSGMCFGGGYVWSGANGASEIEHPTPPINGIFQTDMNGKQISHRQIPFGPKDDGGATHGMTWQPDAGKIWLDSNRLEALIRIDPKTWEVDYIFPSTRVPGLAERLHGIAYDNGFIWQVTGHQKEGTTGYEGYTPGLVKYEIKTGEVVQVVEFVAGSCDIHDVTVYNGQLYGVDAGEHPGWSIDKPAYQHPGFPPLNSPSGGYVFRIDLI